MVVSPPFFGSGSRSEAMFDSVEIAQAFEGKSHTITGSYIRDL
jgi:hypothetical protein